MSGWLLLTGDTIWLNVSMYPDNFTATFAVNCDQIDVVTVTASGTGEHFNISVVGEEYEVTDNPERTFDFSQ